MQTRRPLLSALSSVAVLLGACSDASSPPPADAIPPGEPTMQVQGPSNRDPMLEALSGSAAASDAGLDATPAPKPPPACTGVNGAAVGDWLLFGNGQCLVGIQNFYPAKFGVHVPVARNSWTGGCAPEGACHIWVDDRPDASLWVAIPNNGSELPSTYDMIVIAPFSGNPYGHIASVDRVQGGIIYVMDTNWNLNELKASAPHTLGNLPVYGWYHLKSRPKTVWCSSVPLPASLANQACPQGTGLYCGGNGINGDATTLYDCTGTATTGHVTIAAQCGATCQRMPSGQDDRCP